MTFFDYIKKIRQQISKTRKSPLTKEEVKQQCTDDHFAKKDYEMAAKMKDCYGYNWLDTIICTGFFIDDK